MKIKNNYLYGIAIVEERDKKFQNIKLYTFVRTFFLYAYNIYTGSKIISYAYEYDIICIYHNNFLDFNHHYILAYDMHMVNIKR